MSTKNRETKELSFGNESKENDSTFKENKLEEDNSEFNELLIDKEELENIDEKGHSFYSKREQKEKRKLSKATKISIISGSVFLVLLSVGLGVGFGVDWNPKPKNSVSILGEDYTEWLEDYVSYKVIDAKEQTDVLVAKSINWAFDELYQMNFIDDYDYAFVNDNLEKKINKQVNDEKESYKDQYGDDWSKEWDKHLLDLGYDDEDEYIIDLLSKEIKTYVDEVFLSTGDYFVNRTTSTDTSLSTKYKTSLSVNDFRDGLVTTGSNAMFGVNSNNEPIINSEFLFDSFIKYYNPVSYNDVIFNFTTPSNDLAATINSSVSFASVDELKSDWIFFTDISNSLDTTTSLKLSDYGETNSGVVSMNSSTLASNNEVFNVVLGNYYSDFSSEFSGGDVLNSSFKTWTANLNATIATAYNDYFGYLGSEPEAWPVDATEAIEKINENYWNTLNSNSTLVSKIETDYSSVIFNSGNSITSLDGTRKSYLKTELFYTYDLFDSSSFTWTENKELKDVYVTYSTDGLHFVTPGILSDSPSTMSQGQLMLISDLDKDFASDFNSSTTMNGEKPNNNYTYSILTTYDTWFNSISNFLYLNTALNNDEFRNDNFSLEDYDKNDNNTIEKDEIDELIEQEYNSLYWKNYNQYFSIRNKLDEYYTETNKDIFNVDPSVGYSSLENSIVLLNPNSSFGFSLNSTIDILLNGNLFSTSVRNKKDEIKK